MKSEEKKNEVKVLKDNLTLNKPYTWQMTQPDHHRKIKNSLFLNTKIAYLI